MPKKSEVIEPIDATFDSVVEAVAPPVEAKPPDRDLPFAKWRGKIELGGDELDVYVLNTEARVIALRSAIKSMSGVDSGNLGSYVGVGALKPFINSELILGELLEFSIPGTQFTGRGMTTEHFELICRGYVQALYEGAPSQIANVKLRSNAPSWRPG